jgi:23S rRNA pseudouridine1911/1915/1917 synthase
MVERMGESKMPEELELIVPADSGGKTVRGFLKYNAGFSRSLMRYSTAQNALFLNGRPCRMDTVLRTGDKLTVAVDLGRAQDIVAEQIPLDVVYEDNDLLIVNKPAGMTAHPTPKRTTGTLANAVAGYFQVHGIKALVRLINRLDMDTSGLVMIAKNRHTQHLVAQQMESGETDKRYLAVVSGHLATEPGVIEAPVGRPDDSPRRTVLDEGPAAITHWWVKEYLKGATLLELKIDTGKTHQIRVHMASLGHPVVGDTLYNEENTALIGRQALHAARLSLKQPSTGEPLTVEAPLPADISNLIEQLRF